MPKRATSTLRTLAPWMLGWCGLTVLGTASSLAAAQSAADAGWWPALEQVTKLGANILDCFVIPGWTAARLVGMGRSPLLAHSLGWALLECLAWLLVSLRNRVSNHVSKDEPTSGSLTRRKFLVNSGMGLGALGLGGTAVAATCITPWNLTIGRHLLKIPDLDPAFDGFRVAFIADLHVGRRIPSAFIRRAIDTAIGLKPDLFALGGDYVDFSSEHIDRATELLKPLTQTHRTVVAVLGNHDHYAGAPKCRARLRALGISLIDNSRVFIRPDGNLISAPTGDSALCLAGVGDLLEDSVDFDSALAGVPSAVPRLLLSHNPDVAELPGVATHRIDLILSGHTHGGQVRLPFIGAPIVPSRYGQKYAQGLVQGPSCRVLISKGIGMSLMPVRLGVTPEILEITLRRA